MEDPDRVCASAPHDVQKAEQWSWQNFCLYVLLASTTGLCWWRTGYAEENVYTRMSLVFWFVGELLA